MDRYFDVDCGILATGTKHGLRVTNMSRSLLLKCWTKRKAEEWKDAIEIAMHTHGRDYMQHNRYESFAPARYRSHAQW